MIIFKMVGLPDGRATKYDGWYLRSFDFEAYEGRGDAVFTKSQRHAMRFDDLQAALDFRNRQPECCPLRPDGLPNRPMTATTWECVTIPDRKNVG